MPFIFLDVDGCLCDFAGAVLKLGVVPATGLAPDASPVLKQNMYRRIEEAGESFWSSMDWAPGGKQLWDFLKPYRPTLLTSPGKFRYMKSGRLKWIAKNIPGTPVFFEDEKWYYAHNADDVLLDDQIENVEPWRAKGGSAILHKDYATTIAEFKKLMSKPSMKVPLASYLRDIVAFLTFDQLKKYLMEAQGILNSDSTLKTIITKEVLDKKLMKPEDLKPVYKKLRDVIKSYHADLRPSLQEIILRPLRSFIDNTQYTESERKKKIREFKEIREKKDKEQERSRNLMRDTLPKGVPPSQITPRTQQII
jgi:hypothetical protein